MWRFKPYGEVTIQMAQDANGSPANLMQVGQNMCLCGEVCEEVGWHESS